MGTGRTLCLLVLLALAAVAAPVAASGGPSVVTSVRTLHGGGATASAPVNLLTINDQRGIDNRISAYIGSNGRLVLSAPEGLGDPDGNGSNCSLDNATPGETSSTQVSCAPGYIGAIVGDLGRGSDSFDAAPDLDVMVGAVVDGQRRSLAGGPGRDRLVGGGAADLLVGGGAPDTLIGGAGRDLLIGGAGADKLNGGRAKDLCRGGRGRDAAKNCELAVSIP
jgi:Ca2+-binding RTX toxin-like protein